jgi:hypothetical protein
VQTSKTNQRRFTKLTDLIKLAITFAFLSVLAFVIAAWMLGGIVPALFVLGIVGLIAAIIAVAVSIEMNQ